MTKKVKRLQDQFQPENYQLTLEIDPDKMTFKGSVVIRGQKVGRPASRLTLHQKDLKITRASMMKHDKKGDQTIEVARINKQASYDEVRLHTATPLYPGTYTVNLEFEGLITRPMNGIYPCFFEHDGQAKKLIASQFESHHAREAFPCIDEPAAKASVDLTLITPAGQTVIANTPVKQQSVKNKQQTTVFETTPRMSVYLLAFVLGELGFKEAKTKAGVVVRSYATPDNVRLVDYSLEVAVKALEFFGDYFGVPYPLPKLDMAALPDFSSGAMENWGLVTYRETAMLVDPKASSIESRQLVALVVCHELSHQWFGNLVTMKWWDDLWLNESFANLMEYRAVDELYPEWHIWEQFVAVEAGSAKRRDSLADVQPIRTDVHHPDEISTLFDPSIVYAKGGTVLHMLWRLIGEEAFRQGLKAYFEKHSYGNTEAKDLWQALTAASQHKITEFMDSWLTRPGFPLVSVTWQPGQSNLELKQKRFLTDATAPTDDRPWPVPLASTIALSQDLFSTQSTSLNLQPQPDQPLLLNHDGDSYFLPYYAISAHLQQIVSALSANQISTIDRLLLLDNYNLLQRGGVAATTELIDLLSGYQNETSESVWGAMAGAMGEARKLVEGDEASDKLLDQLIASLVTALAAKLGWDDQPGDDAQTLRLRGLANSLAASAKVPATLDEGLKRVRSFKKPDDLSPSTRTVIYYIGARYGSKQDFDKLLQMHHATHNADEKDELASGLTATKDPASHKVLLALLTTDEIRRQDVMHWFVWLLRNRYSRAASWQWLTSHWSWIEQEFKSDKSYGFFARYCGGVFSRPEELKQFQVFFGPKKSIVALAREINLAEQEITNRIAWRKRNEAKLRAWLKKHLQ